MLTSYNSCLAVQVWQALQEARHSGRRFASVLQKEATRVVKMLLEWVQLFERLHGDVSTQNTMNVLLVAKKKKKNNNDFTFPVFSVGCLRMRVHQPL